MTAELIGWLDEHSLDHRRRMRNAMFVSLAIHGLVIALFAASPPALFAPLPEVLAVELVAAPPSARPSPRARPSPPPESAPSEPASPPPPTPAPPVAKAPVQVLPEEAPGRIRKAAPEVEAKVKPEPRPEPKPVPRRPKREEALSYEDIMAELADESGADEPADLLVPAPTSDEDSNAEAPSRVQKARPGIAISPELAAWNLKVQRRIRSRWPLPASFRGLGLETEIEYRITASGKVIGIPRVIRQSGNPFFDDNAVNALLKAAPLPPPPPSVVEAGRGTLKYTSEAN